MKTALPGARYSFNESCCLFIKFHLNFYVLGPNLHIISCLRVCLSLHPTTYKLWELQVNLHGWHKHGCQDLLYLFNFYIWIMHDICQNSFEWRNLYARILLDRQNFTPDFFLTKKTLCKNSSRQRIYVELN